MTEAPSLEDQPIDDAPEAPEDSDQPSGAEDSLPEFDYSDIPDELRETVEKRIKGFQASFTKARQGDAEARREAESKAQIADALQSGNPDVARAILSQLGYDANKVLEMYGYSTEEADDDEFTDPDEQLRREVQELRQERETEKESREREQQEQAVDNYIGSEIDALESELGYELSKEERDGLDAYSRAFPKEEAGRLIPNVRGAHEFLSGIVKAGNKRLIAGKENAPRKPGGGSAGSRTVDLSKETPEERRARMMNAAGAAQSSG